MEQQLYSIINPSEAGAVQPAQVHLDNFIQETPDAPQPRRSARPRAPRRQATSSSAEAPSRPRKAGTLKGVRKPTGALQSTGSGRGKLATRQDTVLNRGARGVTIASAARATPTRPASRRAAIHAHAQAKERIRHATEAAAARTTTRRDGRRVSIMDVVLDAQPATARLDADDFLDAIEQAQRIALALPSPEDDWLADLFVPGRYEARQAAFWREVLAPVVEDAPYHLYNVSAERTTASWSAELESSDADSRSAWSATRGSP